MASQAFDAKVKKQLPGRRIRAGFSPTLPPLQMHKLSQKTGRWHDISCPAAREIPE
jgi:hypothetical protein